MSSLVEAGALSIARVHRNLERWFLGAPEDEGGEDDMDQLARAMDPSFVLVSPRAVIVARDPLLEEIRGARGAWGNEEPAGRIVVESIEARQVIGDELALLTYVERHVRASGNTARFSTVLMRRHDAAPDGVVWLHLHETWMK